MGNDSRIAVYELFYPGYQEFKWGSCSHKLMCTVQLLNNQFDSGKPDFSQTQSGHDLGVSMGHRPLRTQAVWSQPSCLRRARDLSCITKPHTGDETGSSPSCKEYGNSCFYLWRTLSFKSRPVTTKAWTSPCSPPCFGPLRAAFPHLSWKFPANHPYICGWHREGVISDPPESRMTASLPRTGWQRRLLDQSWNCTVCYKPVLQPDKTEKKERKLYSNSQRKFRANAGSHRNAGQANSRHWMGNGILCLSCSKAKSHRTQVWIFFKTRWEDHD